MSFPSMPKKKPEKLKPKPKVRSLVVKSKPAQVAESPCVGIFWVFEGKLLAYTCAPSDGIDNEWSINGQHDHVDYWPTFQRQHPSLRNIEYEDVTRGRVLFLKKPPTFCVYMDKRLHKPAIKKLILAGFNLPPKQTKFLTDPHYTTDPDDLARIFGET
jgi:hypothetical protein